MAYEYQVRDPFHMPDGRMTARGETLSASDVAALANEDHEEKLARHCVRTLAEETPSAGSFATRRTPPTTPTPDPAA